MPAKVKAGAAVEDRDRAAARGVVGVAVKTVDTETAKIYPEPKQGGKYHAKIRQKRPDGGRFHDRRS